MSEGASMIRVLAYKNILVIDTPEKYWGGTEFFIPNGGSNIGCLVMDTKKHLGVSKEAMTLLRKIKKSGDDIGDVMWWENEGSCTFGWLGPAIRLVNPDVCEGDNDYAVREGQYVEVPNDKIPEGAKTVIDQMSSRKSD